MVSAGWAIELSPIVTKAESRIVAQQPASLAAEPDRRSTHPKIELLNPGAEPRQQLRLEPAINVKQARVITLKIERGTSVNAQSSPALKLPGAVMTFETKVTKIDANGDIHYEFFFANADIAGDTANFPATAIDALRSQLKKMVGVKGSFIMDNRSFDKGGKFIYPEGVDSQLKQQFQQISKEQLSLPLPAEAVGKGAKWRVFSASNFNGINVNNIVTYELTGLQDGVVTLNSSIEQQANPQNLTRPQLPAGATLTLKSFVGQGGGEFIIRLDQLQPVRFIMSFNSHTEIVLKNPGNPEELTFKTQMSMEMTLDSK
ncbi:hypothetical protein QT990_25060 [Microcoleus sp. T3_B1]|uniref:hypothetical protein n=1 Tax=Microcoleus sp. T3_B1 TaxID=3055425 RepID=UPI002FD55F7B